MSFEMRVVGWKQLNKNLRSVVLATNSDHAGIGNALEKAVEIAIIPRARANVRARFDTSGQLGEAIQSRKVNQWAVDIGVYAPHGAIHEYGGTFEVTEKQRAFFWWKYLSTDKEMWKALALSQTYTMPARPYLRPAIDEGIEDALFIASEILAREWAKAVKAPVPPPLTIGDLGSTKAMSRIFITC